MTSPGNSQPMTRQEKWRFRFEIAGVFGIIGALAFSTIGFFAQRAALELTAKQLTEAKYESVYGHQLDLWQLGAGSKELAPYIVGGKLPPAVAESQITDTNNLTEAEAIRATQDAAVSNALDFYAYVFAQLAPSDEEDNAIPNALTVPIDDNIPDGVSEYTWYSWASWGPTIRSGFESAPAMCEQLNSTDDRGTSGYDSEFVTAVHDAGLCL